MGNTNSQNGGGGRGAGGDFSWGSLGGALKQDFTNGKSKLGTVLTPWLPLFLTDNPLPNGYPWSLRDWETDYYHDWPYTGVIRSYDFTVTRDVIAPDGYERPVLLVNGAFPGPLIEANWGDTIQVTVHNNITGPDEGTAFHWHGFLHKNTPWEDGVPSVSQCPIPPGESYTYTIQAELYGSAWYHSHYSAQYAGGLVGPIVIHGPEPLKYDIDIGPVMLIDWYHGEYFDLVEAIMKPGASGIVYSDNNLINGKMNFNCSSLPEDDDTPCNNNAGIAKFKFKRGKTHRLRLMNTGAEALQHFSIDGHTMKVISNDFVKVRSYETKVVTLGIGQRTDVLVRADGDLDAYWMRSNISTVCGITKQPFAYAAIYYDDTDENTEPTSEAWDIPDPGTCANDDLKLTQPLLPLKLPKPDLTFELGVNLYKNESNVTLWSFDDVSFRGNFNSPTLLLADLGNTTFEEEWNVKNTGDAESVRVIVNNPTGAAHPMHLHGFNMFILHEGPDEWDGTTIINPHNPLRRDTFQVRPKGHLVMQFNAADNPGVWPFHCHIAWHVSAGFFVQFLTNPKEVEKLRVPHTVAETCRQWGRWTETNIPEQIDSGL